MSLSSRSFHRRRLLGAFGLAGLATTGLLPAASAQRSPFATPTAPEAATSTAADGPLGQLLAMIPLTRVEEQSSNPLWTYVDIARQYTALGMAHSIDGPDMENEPYLHATYAFMAASNLLLYAADEELPSLIGFHPLGLDQILYAGSPPNQIQLFRAPFDADALVATWQSAGYEERTAPTGESIWTIGPDQEFSPTHPIQRLLLATMNNLALVGDVLIAASDLATVKEVLGHLAEGGPSLLDEPITGPLVSTMPETTVSAVALTASALGISTFETEAIDAQADEIAAIRDEFGVMPAIQGMIAGVNEGAIIVDSDWSPNGTPVTTPRPDAGTAYWNLNAGTPEDAEQVLAIAEARWNRLDSITRSGPYADIMEITGTAIEGSLVEIDFRLLISPMVWYQPILHLDLLPIFPDDPDA